MSQLSPRTRRLAQGLRMLSFAVVSALVFYLFYMVFDPDLMLRAAAKNTLAQPNDTVGAVGRLIVWIAFAMGAGAKGFAFWNVAGLFGRYADGDVFSPRAAALIARIGAGFVATAIAGAIATPMITAGLTLDNAPGARMLSVGLDTTMLGYGVIGGLILIIGAVMRQAADMAIEMQEIV